MAHVKQRSAWTSTRPGGDVRENDNAVMGIALHWPGTTTNRLGVATDDQVKEWLNNWRDFHVDVRGWSDIGYNVGFDQDGRIWILRGVERIGAHAASETNLDANEEWVGFLLMLGDQERPSSDMIQAVRWARKNLVLSRYPKARRVLGHGDVPGAQTACPGPYVREVINMFDDEPNDVPDAPDAPAKPQEVFSMAEPTYRLGRSVYLRSYGDRIASISKDFAENLAKVGVPIVGIPTTDANALRSTLRAENETELSRAFELAAKEEAEDTGTSKPPAKKAVPAVKKEGGK